MKRTKQLTLVVLLALLLPAALFGQEEKVTRGSVELGVRHAWGDVYGRPDLPFTPDIFTSKYNEYRDIRNGFVVPRFFVSLDDVLGSKKYLNAQSQSTFYKNQSYLASFGEYGKFKIQFRYDEIPHTYSNTTRTPYVLAGRGVWTLSPALKTALQTASSTGTAAQINASLPAVVATQLVSGETFIVPAIVRKAGTGLFSYNITPDLNISFLFTRENQVGTRPIGMIFNSSPSASGSGSPGTVPNRQSPGTGVEIPETIDYFTNTVKPSIEFGKKSWVVQVGYTGSFFQNNTPTMTVDNPFATADVPVQIIPPGGGCTPTGSAVNCAIGAIPAHGQMDLYPDNHAHYLNFAGAFDVGKYVRIQGTVNPGWLRQNDPFLPYTANTAITVGALPATSLGGQKQTLAMNWTMVAKPVKSVELAAKYRHYDYNNSSPEHEFTPILGDTIGANATATAQLTPGTAASGSGSIQERPPFGYNRKTFEVSGIWFFAKRSAAKVGWEGEWMDRSHRDVPHSVEHSVFGGIDWSPTRDLLFRVSGRHQNREPEEYQDEAASDAAGVEIPCTSTSVAFTEEQRCHRRFDEASRLLNRADVMVQYNLQKFTFTGSFQTIQSDYNRSGGVNSPVPLNNASSRGLLFGPYYLYGGLKDNSFIYAFDASYAFSKNISLFAEYTHEKYHKRMVSRNRAPTSGVQTILTCTGCDSNNNDWMSTYRDIFDTYATGLDINASKKLYISSFYTLSSGKGNVFSTYLGDPTITTGANAFNLNNTSAPVSYPETTTRIHELAVVFKYKLTKNFVPKFEYRLQQFDNKDYQTSAMTPYMGCISAAPPTALASAPCNVRLITNTTASPTPTFSPSPFYPFFVVGDTSAARYLFLGADQPSYRVHYVAATLEYHF